MERTGAIRAILTPEARELASVAQIGRPIREYSEPFVWQDTARVLLDSALLAICIVAILTNPPFLVLPLDTTQILFVFIYKIIFIFFSIIMLLLLWYALQRYRARKDLLVVCNDGFVYQKNAVIDVFHWQDLALVWHNQKTWAGYLTAIDVTLHQQDGRALTISRTYTKQAAPTIQDFCKRLDDELIRIWLPKVIAAYNAGLTISFGNIAISRQGIGIKQNQLPWPEVRRISYYQTIDIWQKSPHRKWASVSRLQTPNVAVLKVLIAYIISTKSGNTGLYYG